MTAAQSLWTDPSPYGREEGIQNSGDVVRTTLDGVDLNAIWTEVQSIIQAWNDSRDALTSVLSYHTINVAEAIPQSQTLEDFEPATDYGQPTALRPPTEHLLMGFGFGDFDKAGRWTRRFLRDSTAEQVRATLNYALEADNRLVNSAILHQLFSNVAGVNERGNTIFPLYNADNFKVPSYLGRNFNGPHNHYLTSGAAQLDSGDLETVAKTVREHGFGTTPDSQLLALMNPEQAEIVAGWKAGDETATGIFARNSFIPSEGAPAYYSPEPIVGDVAPATYQKLKVEGSYGDVWIVASDYIPGDYFSVVASYGANSPANAIAVREHSNAAYRGFRTIEGPGEYPITDAFYTRAFGTGVRRRGQAACMQITADPTYTPPEIFGYVQPSNDAYAAM